MTSGPPTGDGNGASTEEVTKGFGQPRALIKALGI
jgi:hypothetical protein